MTLPRPQLQAAEPAQLLGHTPLHRVGCQQDRWAGEWEAGHTQGRYNLDKQGTGEEYSRAARGTRKPGKGDEQRTERSDSHLADPCGQGGGSQAGQGAALVEGLWPQHGQCRRLSRGGLWA